jgi:hypothetical protein
VNRIKTIKTVTFLVIILLIGYFYSLEIRKNWAELQNFKLTINVYYLMVSLPLWFLSYLAETFIWKISINKHLGSHELNFPQSIAIVNTSALFKYLPGRIWAYTAQLVWLKKYNISKSIILYVNLLCILGSVTVSLYLGLIYLALYTKAMNVKLIILSAVVLILLNIMYVIWNVRLINRLIAIVGKLLHKEIQPLKNSRSLIIFIQLIYVCISALAGLGSYYFARGIGLPVHFTDFFAILASLSLSWLVGYITVISPGGLGIREGMMLLMLNNVVSAQTALIFPIMSRAMYLMAEAIMGVTALSIGVKYKVFSLKKGG